MSVFTTIFICAIKLLKERSSVNLRYGIDLIICVVISPSHVIILVKVREHVANHLVENYYQGMVWFNHTVGVVYCGRVSSNDSDCNGEHCQISDLVGLNLDVNGGRMALDYAEVSIYVYGLAISS